VILPLVSAGFVVFTNSFGSEVVDLAVATAWAVLPVVIFYKFYGRYNDRIYNYKLSLSHMLCDIFHTNS
jgi:hypothetical protein